MVDCSPGKFELFLNTYIQKLKHKAYNTYTHTYLDSNSPHQVGLFSKPLATTYMYPNNKHLLTSNINTNEYTRNATASVAAVGGKALGGAPGVIGNDIFLNNNLTLSHSHISTIHNNLTHSLPTRRVAQPKAPSVLGAGQTMHEVLVGTQQGGMSGFGQQHSTLTLFF